MSATPGQVADWWDRWCGQADEAARDQLVEYYIHLVQQVAGSIQVSLPASVGYDDLAGYGAFGLLEAIDRYDPSRGFKFETFAVPRIKGAMIDGLRQLDWLPQGARRQAKRVDQMYYELKAQQGEAPGVSELADALGWSERQVDEVLRDYHLGFMLSLEAELAGGEAEQLTLADVVPAGDAGAWQSLQQQERERLLAAAIERLNEDEQLVISLYYFEDLTGAEIAAVLELSAARVSQLHRQAILRLRGSLSRVKQQLV